MLDIKFMRFPRFLLLLLIAIPLAVYAEKPASKTKAEDKDLNSLVERLEKISSISGEFVQYSVDQSGVRIQESRGEFKAQRPGKFYWYTRDPLEQGIYSDGKNVTIFDPDLEQATIQPVSDQIQNTPAILFSGDVKKIGDKFEVEMRVFNDVSTQFLLIPKTQDSLFERMQIRFDGVQITEMRLSDSLGQENTVSFIHTQINDTFPESAFAPSFPEGTDIIRDLPAQVIN